MNAHLTQAYGEGAYPRGTRRAPGASGEGSRKAGSPSGGEATAALTVRQRARIPLRDRIFLRAALPWGRALLITPTATYGLLHLRFAVSEAGCSGGAGYGGRAVKKFIG